MKGAVRLCAYRLERLRIYCFLGPRLVHARQHGTTDIVNTKYRDKTDPPLRCYHTLSSSVLGDT